MLWLALANPALGGKQDRTRGCPQELPLAAKIRLLVTVPSRPERSPRRDAIRDTWCARAARVGEAGGAAVAVRFWVGGTRDALGLDAEINAEADYYADVSRARRRRAVPIDRERRRCRARRCYRASTAQRAASRRSWPRWSSSTSIRRRRRIGRPRPTTLTCFPSGSRRGSARETRRGE